MLMKKSDPYIGDVVEQLNGVTMKDFAPFEGQIPVESEDGQKVAILLTGMARDGLLADAKGVEMTVEAEQPKAGFKNMLSEKNAADNDTEEENYE